MSVFDKEKWNKCCIEEGVKFPKKGTHGYERVLACYRRSSPPKIVNSKIPDTFTEEELNEIFHAMDILEQKVSPKNNPKVSAKVSAKVSPKVSAKVSPKQRSRSPKISPKVSAKVSPKVSPKVSAKVSPKQRSRSPKVSPKVDIKLDNIVEMLNHAKETLKSPSIQIVTDDATYSLTIAGEQSQLPGTINIVSKSIWYGRIFLDGKFQPSKKIPEPIIEQLMNALQAFNNNPERMAHAYGRRTGRCCFCNLPLTNEKSIDVGYGPVCARNFRLKYGKK